MNDFELMKRNLADLDDDTMKVVRRLANGGTMTGLKDEHFDRLRAIEAITLTTRNLFTLTGMADEALKELDTERNSE